MKVQLSAVGVTKHDVDLNWPADWPIPRVDDDIDIPDLPEVSSVRAVCWFPKGSEDSNEPFVYIVIGPGRP
jgi:hypothetical protein